MEIEEKIKEDVKRSIETKKKMPLIQAWLKNGYSPSPHSYKAKCVYRLYLHVLVKA